MLRCDLARDGAAGRVRLGAARLDVVSAGKAGGEWVAWKALAWQDRARLAWGDLACLG